MAELGIILALLISLYAQYKVSSNFNKFSKVKSEKGYTGAEVARILLEKNGISNVTVTKVAGSLTDHFDPRSNIIRLSEPVYDSTSIAAIAVAAHETGHAIQHDTGYIPLNIRSGIFPVASFGSKLGIYLVMIGLVIGSLGNVFVSIGILLFAFYVAFSLITLPVEFNASSRALNILEENYIISNSEVSSAKKVLSAAALTYVAAALSAVFTLLRYLSMASRRR